MDVKVRIPDYDTVPDRRMLGTQRPPSSSAHGPEMISPNDEEDETSQSKPQEKDVVDELLREWTTILG